MKQPSLITKNVNFYKEKSLIGLTPRERKKKKSKKIFSPFFVEEGKRQHVEVVKAGHNPILSLRIKRNKSLDSIYFFVKFWIPLALVKFCMKIFFVTSFFL
jgi:hypothetical protein